MNSRFETEEEARAFMEKHQVKARQPERLGPSGKWALVFPLKAHVTVIPHTSPD
jgi:hypothetical protein